MVVKYRTMTGHHAPYVPGWDCHGLPIELAVERDLGDKLASMSKLEVRQECHKAATKWMETQRGEFQRLGVFGGSAQLFVASMAEVLDGFSPVAAGYLRFTGPLDPSSLPATPPDALEPDSDWSYLISFLPGLKSAGGTESILRNTIGERVLGLPPEPRLDKGIPFSELRAKEKEAVAK